MAADMSHTPAIAVATVRIVRPTSGLWSSRAGEKTKRNGTTYAVQPNRTDVQLVAIGDAPAMEAAKNAAIATGGVRNDIIPRYMTNMWAAIGSTPSSTSDGAISAARMM